MCRSAGMWSRSGGPERGVDVEIDDPLLAYRHAPLKRHLEQSPASGGVQQAFLGSGYQSPLLCSYKSEHRLGCAFGRRSPGNHDTRIQKQPHGCSRSRLMSASSSAIQPAISSAEKTRGSGKTAPSARSREARKSINSCFSAGVSETGAASMSASVSMLTSVYFAKTIRKAHVPGPRTRLPNLCLFAYGAAGGLIGWSGGGFGRFLPVHARRRAGRF
jgi:hypothetical protein